MKKEYEKKKKLVVLILAVVAVCLAGGLCLYLAKTGAPAEPDTEARQEVTRQPEVAVPKIDIPEQTAVSEETKPEKTENGGEETESAQSGESVGEESENPRTKEDAQPPSEKPEPTGGDAAGNPEQPPQYEPEVTEPEQKPEEPAGGAANGNGQAYVPGFGYVDQPGAAQGEAAGSSGDWDKQIGDMN